MLDAAVFEVLTKSCIFQHWKSWIFLSCNAKEVTCWCFFNLEISFSLQGVKHVQSIVKLAEVQPKYLALCHP
jgi:hypothetical protein